jgi:hypothetical protein
VTGTDTIACARPKPRDWVVVQPRGVGGRPRRGLILEVLGTGDRERYRVLWDEEHESIFYPSGAVSIEPTLVERACRADRPCDLRDN